MHLLIPDGLDFANLKLRRLSDGSLAFQVGVLRRVAAANGLPSAIAGDSAVELILRWYREHLDSGGARDAVIDQTFAQLAAESAFGKTRVMRGPVRPQ